MISVPERIFIIGMPGAGNLGDDLISACLIDHLHQRWPKAQIGLLTSGHTISFLYQETANLRFFLAPRFSEINAYHKRMSLISNFLKTGDLIIVGGGGLFQDTHHYFTIYNWLKYLFQSFKIDCPVWGIGLGIGPIKHMFSQIYLRKMLSRFDILQVRDESSAMVVKNMGYYSEVAPDIVAGTSIKKYGFERTRIHSALGCAIRPWPGLQIVSIVNLIERIAIKYSLAVRLFVFEYYEPLNTKELDCARSLAEQLKKRGIQADIFCYRKDSIDAFCDAFNSLQRAIAIRFHANILWQKLKVPVLPLSYAPKVTSLYKENSTRLIKRVQDIEMIDIEEDCFLTIEMARSYSLPSATAVDRDGKTLTVNEFALNKVYGVANFFYTFMHGLGWRFKRLFLQS